MLLSISDMNIVDVGFKILTTYLGRSGQNSSRGPNFITLLVFYNNYVELILHLDLYLIELLSVKKHCIFKKCMHRSPQ